MAKTLTKVARWLAELSDLSAKYGIALCEITDCALVRDSKNGKVLGRNMAYICGLYTAHKSLTTKPKETNQRYPARDVHGFASSLSDLSRTHGVQLELRSCPMLLVDAQTFEPIARLVTIRDGFAAAELQPA